MNLDTLSSDSSEEEIRDLVRAFQSVIVWGEKLHILIDIFTSIGYQKDQGVLISATPSFGNKVICRYHGFNFQTLVND